MSVLLLNYSFLFQLLLIVILRLYEVGLLPLHLVIPLYYLLKGLPLNLYFFVVSSSLELFLLFEHFHHNFASVIAFFFGSLCKAAYHHNHGTNEMETASTYNQPHDIPPFGRPVGDQQNSESQGRSQSLQQIGVRLSTNQQHEHERLKRYQNHSLRCELEYNHQRRSQQVNDEYIVEVSAVLLVELTEVARQKFALQEPFEAAKYGGSRLLLFLSRAKCAPKVANHLRPSVVGVQGVYSECYRGDDYERIEELKLVNVQ